MRALLSVILVALVTPALAGCLSAEVVNPNALAALDPSLVKAEGATAVTAVPGGVALLWEGALTGPEEKAFTFPDGVTLVTVSLTWDPAGVAPGLFVFDEATGRNRCPTTLPLDGTKGVATCRGLAVLDPAPATWKARLTAFPDTQSGETVPFRLEVRLLAAPLDGPAALIDLDALSKPVFGVLDTVSGYVEASSDGARLFVEHTLPDGDGPFPTILVSSPYNNALRVNGLRPSDNVVKDYVPRGYAVAVADVRGFGNSEGCVEVWGPKEQQDQYDLVEWVAAQPWSDGKVGMYGQSYVGTTPHEAAVMRAPHLTAIATVAGLTDPYYDWHFGGVPNGESLGSPVSYQQIGAETPPEDMPLQDAILLHANDFCGEPFFTASANDPRAVYDAFYEERNLSARVKDIQVPVLYTQGFVDSNVKPWMAHDWFNEIETPKLGFFGQWTHRHPPRADFELMLHAWFDHWLKGRDTGIMDVPTAQVMTNVGTVRSAAEFPPRDATPAYAYLDAASGALAAEPAAAAEARYVAKPAPVPQGGLVGILAGGLAQLEFAGEPLAERVYISGSPSLELSATLAGITNTHFAAFLYDEDEEGKRTQVSFGMFNAAHRDGHDQYVPVPAGEAIAYRVPFQPREYVVEPGHRLVLTLRSAEVKDWFLVGPTEPGIVTVATGGDSGTRLVLPTLAAAADAALPATV